LNEKSATLYSVGLGVGFTLTPIVAGALMDYKNWRFMTDVMAVWALGLSAIYGILIIVGCSTVTNYWKKPSTPTKETELAA
jgi:MFS family permease